MTTPTTRSNRPGNPAETSRAPERSSPAPASDWRDRLGAFFASALLALALVGCGAPASRYCFLVSDGVVRSVDLGMQVAGDLYKSGHLSEAVKAKLIASHDTYRPIASAVVAGCKVLDDSEVKKADELISKMNAAAGPLLADLKGIGVK